MNSRPWFGASWKIAAFACYAALNGVAKHLTNGAEGRVALPASEMVFFQDLVALIILLPWMLKKSKLSFLKQHKILNISRAVFSACAIISWYLTLFYMPLAHAVALSIIGPIIGVVAAKIFLKEKMGMKRLSVIISSFFLACFLSHLSLAWTANQYNLKGIGFLLLSSVMFALAKITTRRLALLGTSPKQLTTSLFMFIVPVSLVPAIFQWVRPEWSHVPWFLFAGIITGLAIYCVSSALVYAEVSFLAPFDICQFILNSLVGYFAFMELPAPWAIWLVLAFFGFSLTFRRRLFL